VLRDAAIPAPEEIRAVPAATPACDAATPAGLSSFTPNLRPSQSPSPLALNMPRAQLCGSHLKAFTCVSNNPRAPGIYLQQYRPADRPLSVTLSPSSDECPAATKYRSRPVVEKHPTKRHKDDAGNIANTHSRHGVHKIVNHGLATSMGSLRSFIPCPGIFRQEDQPYHLFASLTTRRNNSALLVPIRSLHLAASLYIDVLALSISRRLANDFTSLTSRDSTKLL
jgi:hypothetical protein